MTDNTWAAKVLEEVPRYVLNMLAINMEKNPHGAWVKLLDVEAAIAKLAEGDHAKLIADCELAAKVLADTGKFETGQSILREAAAHIAALTAQVAELEVKLGGALLGQWIDAGMPNDPAKAEAAALRAKLARIASAWPIVRDADCSGGTLASAMDEIEAAISDGAADE